MDFLAPLDDLAVLRIDGADAKDFLHAQLSNDISGLTSSEARLAAYCNPKGRMLGSLVLWHESDQPDSPLLALVKADAAEAMLKRLRMFVLRAKVSFEPTDLRVYGVSSASSAAGVQTSAGGAPLSEETTPGATNDVLRPESAWKLRRLNDCVLISAPSATGALARWWLVGGPEFDSAAWATEHGLLMREAPAWQAQDIEAGLGWVEHANQELFIPQSLNFDISGGVSFTKGCYPGQEVVARAHFRGAVKRRGIPAYCRLPSDPALQAGMDIFDAARPGAPAGRIINAAGGAPSHEGLTPWHLFLEINLGDIDQSDFRVGSAEGEAIKLLPVPYSLEAKPTE